MHQLKVKIKCNGKSLDCITFDKKWVYAASSCAWQRWFGSFGTTPQVSKFCFLFSLVSSVWCVIGPTIYSLISKIPPTLFFIILIPYYSSLTLTTLVSHFAHPYYLFQSEPSSEYFSARLILSLSLYNDRPACFWPLNTGKQSAFHFYIGGMVSHQTRFYPWFHFILGFFSHPFFSIYIHCI